ncbi:MAG: Os1348 family NHLP clan protein [Candidatus Eiseniibacteriota bacterium]
MSRYAVNTLLYRLKKDPDFRARFVADRDGALADADLTDAEREALVHWDPHRINALGGYLHLLMSIPGLEGH